MHLNKDSLAKIKGNDPAIKLLCLTPGDLKNCAKLEIVVYWIGQHKSIERIALWEFDQRNQHDN
jgi:DNA-directed RNA polymerase subunit H (RpoH/RPB5)